MMVFVFQFPVVAVDHWCPVTNPYTHMQHGHIRVLLAMGIEQQVSNVFPFIKFSMSDNTILAF